MPKDITLLPSGSQSSSGSKTLGFGWGKNQGRTKITSTYSLSASGAEVGNTMVVEQGYAPLSITVNNDESTKSVRRQSSSSSVDVPFAGICNGRQMEYTRLSDSISVTSCKESSGSVAANVGTTWGNVSNFQGGSSTYGWTMVFNIPPEVPDGTYNLADIETRDSSNRLSDNKRLCVILSTEGSVDPEPSTSLSVTIYPKPVVVGVGGTRALSYSKSPVNANITSVSWSLANTQIATVSQNGTVTGVADGEAIVVLNVRDSQGNTASDSANVRVYAEGTISGTDTTYSGSYETAQTPLSLFNMNVSTLTVSWPSSVTWIGSGQVLNNGSSYYVLFNTLKNTDPDNPRSAVITVSGRDMLGNDKSCTFTLTQQRYYMPCTSMSVSGDSTINNSGNSAEYTASYQPSGTTQTSCVWSVTGSGTNYVSLDTSVPNVCTVHVLDGASNESVRLIATNTANNSISAYKDITVTYVDIVGEITASSYNCRVAAIDTYLDDTNGGPELTFTNIIEGSANVPQAYITGFIDTADLITANGRTYLGVTFSQNTSTTNERSGSVRVTALDLDNDEVYITIGYTQARKQESPNAIVIDSFTIRQAGGKVEATATVRYRNRSNAVSTFYSPVLHMGGDHVISINVANVTSVAAGSDFSVTYDKTDYAQMSWTGIVGTSYTLKVVSESIESQTVNATIIDD